MYACNRLRECAAQPQSPLCMSRYNFNEMALDKATSQQSTNTQNKTKAKKKNIAKLELCYIPFLNLDTPVG